MPKRACRHGMHRRIGIGHPRLSAQPPELVDAIYEAGVMPDRWRALLDRLADLVGAKGGMLIGASQRDVANVRSPAIDEFVEAFIAGGWSRNNSRITKFRSASPRPGFRSDRDLHTLREIATLPIYVDFLTPRGAEAGATTVIQRMASDPIAMTLEMFADHDTAQAAIPVLDALHPHIARAAALSARLNLDRVTAAMDALEMIGASAATLDERGRLQIATGRFQAAIGTAYFDSSARLQLRSPTADQQLRDALKGTAEGRGGATVVLRQTDGRMPIALHILPVRGVARDVFCKAAVIVIASDGEPQQAPSPSLLQALFDLTPAEARVAEAVNRGKPLEEIAGAAMVSRETIRTHLKHVYQKTGVARQSDLATLIGAYAVPPEDRPRART